jgi:hypothetical protein
VPIGQTLGRDPESTRDCHLLDLVFLIQTDMLRKASILQRFLASETQYQATIPRQNARKLGEATLNICPVEYRIDATRFAEILPWIGQGLSRRTSERESATLYE